jgi:hypothetical protein
VPPSCCLCSNAPPTSLGNCVAIGRSRRYTVSHTFSVLGVHKNETIDVSTPKHVTHFIGSCVCSRARLDGCEKSRPPTRIRSPNRPARSQSLYRLRYLAHTRNAYQNYFLRMKAPGVYGWQPYHLQVPIFLKSGSLNLLEHLGSVQACNGIALPLLKTIMNRKASSSVSTEKAGWWPVINTIPN